MITALVSALSKTLVRHDIAMTGEITLTGRVLAIGGLREKTTAAYTRGIKTVLIPEANVPDLEEIDPIVKSGLNFVPCRCVNDVLAEALCSVSSEQHESDAKRSNVKSAKGRSGCVYAESDN